MFKKGLGILATLSIIVAPCAALTGCSGSGSLISQFKDAINRGETFAAFVGTSTCPACQNLNGAVWSRLDDHYTDKDAQATPSTTETYWQHYTNIWNNDLANQGRPSGLDFKHYAFESVVGTASDDKDWPGKNLYSWVFDENNNDSLRVKLYNQMQQVASDIKSANDLKLPSVWLFLNGNLVKVYDMQHYTLGGEINWLNLGDNAVNIPYLVNEVLNAMTSAWSSYSS